MSLLLRDLGLHTITCLAAMFLHEISITMRYKVGDSTQCGSFSALSFPLTSPFSSGLFFKAIYACNCFLLMWAKSFPWN